MAAIESWLNKKNTKISFTRLFESENFPNPDKIDWLIIMGGPMSVNDETEFSWIKKEKAFIKECIDKGKTVIGICLGAQFIASVLGSKIYKNHVKERR
jgi:GMP synthase-like glutamine amidotransferase